jgi:hypothetical protein
MLYFPLYTTVIYSGYQYLFLPANINVKNNLNKEPIKALITNSPYKLKVILSTRNRSDDRYHNPLWFLTFKNHFTEIYAARLMVRILHTFRVKRFIRNISRQTALGQSTKTPDYSDSGSRMLSRHCGFQLKAFVLR